MKSSSFSLENPGLKRQPSRPEAIFLRHEAPMRGDLHSGVSGPNHKHTSFVIPPLGWVMAWVRDVMIVAEVLHDIRWAAPWDQSPSAPSRSEPSKTAARR
jgi:hypothetical protein